MSAPEIMTTGEAAEYLRVSRQTLEINRHKGRGPIFVRVGRLIRYRKSDIDAYLAGNLHQNTIIEGGV